MKKRGLLGSELKTKALLAISAFTASCSYCAVSQSPFSAKKGQVFQCGPFQEKGKGDGDLAFKLRKLIYAWEDTISVKGTILQSKASHIKTEGRIVDQKKYK